jgi:hypothetical protein
MYVFGNGDLLAQKNRMWETVIDEFKEHPLLVIVILTMFSGSRNLPELGKYPRMVRRRWNPNSGR